MGHKLKCIAVTRSFGVSEKNISYEMHQVVAFTSFQPFAKGDPGQKGHYDRSGYGSELMEVPVLKSFYPALLKYFQEHYRGDPLLIDFTTTLERRGRNTITVVDGFEVPSSDSSSVKSSAQLSGFPGQKVGT